MCFSTWLPPEVTAQLEADQVVTNYLTRTKPGICFFAERGMESSTSRQWLTKHLKVGTMYTARGEAG